MGTVIEFAIWFMNAEAYKHAVDKHTVLYSIRSRNSSDISYIISLECRVLC